MRGGMMGMGGGTTNRRYNLTLSVNARNLFNNVNFGLPGLTMATPAALGRFSTTIGNPCSI